MKTKLKTFTSKIADDKAIHRLQVKAELERLGIRELTSHQVSKELLKQESLFSERLPYLSRQGKTKLANWIDSRFPLLKTDSFFVASLPEIWFAKNQRLKIEADKDSVKENIFSGMLENLMIVLTSETVQIDSLESLYLAIKKIREAKKIESKEASTQRAITKKDFDDRVKADRIEIFKVESQNFSRYESKGIETNNKSRVLKLQNQVDKLDRKTRVLRLLKMGQSKSSLAKKFNINRLTILRWEKALTV